MAEQRPVQQNSWWRLIRKIVVTTVGLAVILLGIILLVIPGPGILTIIFGLVILSVEYPGVKRLITWLKQKVAERREKKRT